MSYRNIRSKEKNEYEMRFQEYLNRAIIATIVRRMITANIPTMDQFFSCA